MISEKGNKKLYTQVEWNLLAAPKNPRDIFDYFCNVKRWWRLWRKRGGGRGPRAVGWGGWRFQSVPARKWNDCIDWIIQENGRKCFHGQDELLFGHRWCCHRCYCCCCCCCSSSSSSWRQCNKDLFPFFSPRDWKDEKEHFDGACAALLIESNWSSDRMERITYNSLILLISPSLPPSLPPPAHSDKLPFGLLPPPSSSASFPELIYRLYRTAQKWSIFSPVAGLSANQPA